MASAGEKTPLLTDSGRSAKNGPVPSIKVVEQQADSSSPDTENPSSPSKSIFEKIVQPCFAEFVGTAIYVFIGSLSMQLIVMARGLVHGVAIVVLFASIGMRSGGHFNPNITLAAVLCRGIPIVGGVLYIIAQLLGSILGAALCRGALSYTDMTESVTLYERINGGMFVLGFGVHPGNAILIESILTFVVVLTPMMTLVDTNGLRAMAPLSMGFSVATIMIAGGIQTGGAANIARVFGPCVLMSDLNSSIWSNFYIYLAGSLIGTFSAVVIYRLIFSSSDRRWWCK